MNKLFFKAEGEGRPLILIHGFCETSELWQGFSSELAKSYRVYSVDLPGFGQSPLPASSFTIDDIGAYILEWIKDQKISNPLLIGHSLGGYVALAVGAQVPEMIAGIVLFHSTAFPDSEEKKTNRNKSIEFVRKHGVDLFIDNFVPGLFYDKKDSKIPLVDKMARQTKLGTLINYSTAMRDRPSRINFLKEFAKPFLALGGQHDTIVTPEATLQHGSLSPYSQAHLLPLSAHIGMLEQTDLSLERIKEFAGRAFQ
jgi:pimeloyl-ACP methyl ester carboxylesterase